MSPRRFWIGLAVAALVIALIVGVSLVDSEPDRLRDDSTRDYVEEAQEIGDERP